LRGNHWRSRLHEVLQDKLGDPQQDGQMALTFEIIYGHAYKPRPRVRVSGSSAVSLQDMRAMLREGGHKS
jgi:malonyl-CoA O-methyltransferase